MEKLIGDLRRELFGLLIYSGVRLFESDKEIEDTEI